jgi:AcrR family transcriptional regulator
MPTTTEAAASTPKRDHLLATAYHLFYRHGYHAVGIDTILAEAKLAKMTLYHHFASKDELIVAALDARSAENRTNLRQHLEATGGSPRKRLHAIFDRYEAWFKSADFRGCGFIRAAAEYPELKSPIHQAVIRHKQHMIDLLQELFVELKAPNAEALARQTHLALEGAIVTAHTFGDASAIAAARATTNALLKTIDT